MYLIRYIYIGFFYFNNQYIIKICIMVTLKIIWDFIRKILKSKWFWFSALIILVVILFWKNRQNKLEVERLNQNNIVLNEHFKVLKTKNGELFYTVNSLSLTKKEFEETNGKLNQELKDMGIKYKNIQSITQMNISYKEKYEKLIGHPITINDTVYIPSVIDSTFYFNDKKVIHYVNEYSFSDKKESSEITGKINIPTTFVKEYDLYLLNKDINPFVSNLNFAINDTLSVVPVINYKRVWIFFKRPQSVTVHIKSENPIFNLNQIKSFQLRK